ncbi:MAG: ribonuclease [Pseudobdellovibrio sp.]|jgi:ribonuclease R|nr:ribonuclease [Pseudobdellovibrio sp.]
MINQKSSKQKTLNGIIKRHPDGFGFFIPEDKEHPDVYVPQHAMKSAMTNDRATIVVEKERDGRFRGEIIRITERATKRIAGSFKKASPEYGIIKDEGRGWGKDLRIPMEKSKGAQDGDLVEASITSFPDEGTFEGEVLNVLGDAKDPLNDIKRVVITQNIPEHFSKETLQEAKTFSNNPVEKDFAGRKDLRGLNIITIDGATAKDFDDAVYTEMTDSGFHLYVAIADVSHYVQPGTSMDKEAYERGTSVYFPNFVIPMLPEQLSNGLCSLNPHVPRLALVAEMKFDFNGEMKSSVFYEGVIESKARVTYGEAQELIDGAEIQKLDHVKDNIFRCADLAKVLMAKRFKEGSLDLEVPETELVIDGAGEPVDVIKSERLFAHRLIEELMLAANVAVAKFFHEKQIPAFYRIHDAPDEEKISNLQNYMEGMGERITLGGGKLQKRLTRALQHFEGKPEAQIIHILTLRSMSQAKYTNVNVGHFGLGFDFYTHFTSPIRRYPDLIVHRLLKNLVMPNSRYRLMAEDDLATAGTWLSACEQRSAKAERQIQAIKKARFMNKLVGESFDGLISSVTKFGVFVLLREFNIDGLVRLDDLGGERFEFDEQNLTLTAKRSGFSYKMGDVVRVTVSMVDIEQGQINFVLEGHESKATTHNDVSHKGRGRAESNASFRHGKKDSSNERGKDRYASGAKGRTGSGGKGRDKSEKTERDFSKKRGLPSRGSHRSEGRDESPSRGGKQNTKFKFSESRSSGGKKDGGKKFSRPERPAAVAKESFYNPAPATAKPSGEYVPQPRYSSLSDYLDQRKKKGSHETESEQKRPARASENRSNTEKRGEAKNDRRSAGKARPQKFGRKNKSR